MSRAPSHSVSRSLLTVCTGLATASAFALLTPSLSSAQTTNWTGANSALWSDAGNWDNGVPNVATEIAIVGAPSPTVSNINVTLGGLTVESDGVLQLTTGRNFDFDPTATIVNQGAIEIGTNVDFQLVNVVANDGTITVDGSGTVSDLELLAPATLDGAGSVVLAGVNARINDQSGLQTLTNGASHTIRGHGNVGTNTISLVNEGLIVADVAGETLFVDPNSSTGTLDNNGALRATGGGVLAFNGGVFDNTDGVIESAGGQVRFNNAARINGGTISGADVAQTASTNAFFTDVTFNATVAVENNTDFGVEGTITNNGTITVTSTGSTTDVELQTDTTLAGTGSLVLAGTFARINDAAGLQTLTNGADHTIRGFGNVGNSTINAVNNGLIVADVAGETLLVDPSGSTGTLDNNGTLRATGGGVLAFNGGVFDNTDGVIESAGGQVRFNNAARINGGTISGADIAQTVGSNVFFTDVTINGTVNVENNTDFGVEGTITNNGTITVTSTGAATDVELQTDTTLAGTGTLVLEGTFARINDATGTQVLTNGAGHTLAGTGNIGSNTIEIVNNGVILGDGNASPLTIDPVGGATSSSFSGDGVIRAVNGGSVRLESASYAFEDGTFEAIGPGSAVTRSTSTFNVFIGSVRAIDGGNVSVVDQSIADVDVIGNDDLIELRGASFTDIFNNTANVPFDDSGRTIGSPISSPGFGFSRIFSANSGDFIIGDGYDFRAGSFQNGEFSNSGTIVAEAGSTFSAAGYQILGITTGSATLFQATRSEAFVNTGTLAGSGKIANSNTLFNPVFPKITNGFFEGDVLESDGIIAPGDSAAETGTLTLHARDILLGDANDIQIDIGVGGFDAVDFITEPTSVIGLPDIINTVDLNGELSVSLLDDYMPQDGDMFTILTADEGFTGVFDTETLPVLDDCLLWRVNYNATSVVLEVFEPDFIPGDFNDDGKVDNTDLNLLLSNWGESSVPPEWTNGFTGPLVDNNELNDLLLKWGFGTATAPVPEPATLLVAAIGAAGLVRRRR